MNRRRFLSSGFGLALTAGLGCRETQIARVMSDDNKPFITRAEYSKSIDEALEKLLARIKKPEWNPSAGGFTEDLDVPIKPGSYGFPPPRIGFVGLENKSSEDLGDFKSGIVEILDTHTAYMGDHFSKLSRMLVEAGLHEAHLRHEELKIPKNQQIFIKVMKAKGLTVHYLLFATLTSGTTDKTLTEKDYLLTLELVDIKNGTTDLELATLRFRNPR